MTLMARTADTRRQRTLAEHTSDDLAQRVAIQNAVAHTADHHQRAYDPATMPATPEEWVTRLTASLGCIAAVDSDELEHYLIAHAAEVLLWLETRARETAR